MKQLTLQDFKERTEAIARARKIFIPHITKNISVAFMLYQEVLADYERKVFLNTVNGGKVPMSWLDNFERPRCPKCNEPLYLRLIHVKQGPRNMKGWQSCWECVGTNCYFEEYSKKSINEWIQRLKRRIN